MSMEGKSDRDQLKQQLFELEKTIKEKEKKISDMDQNGAEELAEKLAGLNLTEHKVLDIDNFSEIELQRLRYFLAFSRNETTSYELLKTFDNFADFRSFKAKLASLADFPLIKEVTEACHKKF